MYNINTLNPRHRAAYDRTAELYQQFMERQWELRGLLRQRDYSRRPQIQIQTERSYNKDIVKYLQWLRYALQGCDKDELDKKCPWWYWTTCYTWSGKHIHISEWAEKTLGIDVSGMKMDEKVGCVFCREKEFIDRLIDVIYPPKTNSIFGVLDLSDDDIEFQCEIDRIKKLMKFD